MFGDEAGRGSHRETEGQVNCTMKLEGQGSVEQLEKDRPRGKCRKWRLWVRAGGRNRSRRFSGTYREALRALEAFKSEIAGEVPNSETFAAYAGSWAAWRAESGTVGKSTAAKDARHVRALCMVLGGMAMDAIGPGECRAALSELRHGGGASGRELTNTTMRGMHVYLRAILQQAEDEGRIASNPMRHVDDPPPDTAEREALSPEELQLLLNRLDSLPVDGRVVACYLMACLGLRRGEACALMDADVSGGLARVRGSVRESDGKVGPTKTRYSSLILLGMPSPPSLLIFSPRFRPIPASEGQERKHSFRAFREEMQGHGKIYIWNHGQSVLF